MLEPIYSNNKNLCYKNVQNPKLYFWVLYKSIVLKFEILIDKNYKL